MERLLALRPRFVGYATSLVHDPVAADDLVQESFARAVEHLGDLADESKAVSWFYSVIRNAAADRGRRLKIERTALSALAHEVPAADDTAVRAAYKPCGCVSGLAANLKPEYADALHSIEVEEQQVTAFARERGISPQNAGVRIFRARRALGERVAAHCGACSEDGCVSCSCG
jgi:RNA polymerase sigma factor (sigma-70 family)